MRTNEYRRTDGALCLTKPLKTLLCLFCRVLTSKTEKKILRLRFDCKASVVFMLFCFHFVAV